MKGRTPSVFMLIFLLMACAVSCLAQAEEIRGIVTDPSGAVVVGAVVQLWVGNQVIATTKTDGKGSYAIQFEHEQIPAGQVRLSVTAEGFATADRKIDLVPGTHPVVAVRLEIAAVSEQIHVEAKSQPFQDQLDLSEVRESPARDIGEALTEVDGVYKIRRGGIANDVLVRGFQQGNINVLIDGARVYSACPDHMDPAAYHADFAEVERVEVIKGPFDVTSEGGLGAAIRVVTMTPPLGPRITPSIGFGSFGYYNPSITASFGNDAFRILAGYSYRVSDPYKDGSGKSFLDYANYNMAATQRACLRHQHGLGRDGVYARRKPEAVAGLHAPAERTHSPSLSDDGHRLRQCRPSVPQVRDQQSGGPRACHPGTVVLHAGNSLHERPLPHELRDGHGRLRG